MNAIEEEEYSSLIADKIAMKIKVDIKEVKIQDSDEQDYSNDSER